MKNFSLIFINLICCVFLITSCGGGGSGSGTIPVIPTNIPTVIQEGTPTAVPATGTVTGRVFETDGITPIGGAFLILSKSVTVSPGFMAEDSSYMTTTSQEDGTYAFQNVSQGYWRLEMWRNQVLYQSNPGTPSGAANVIVSDSTIIVNITYSVVSTPIPTVGSITPVPTFTPGPPSGPTNTPVNIPGSTPTNTPVTPVPSNTPGQNAFVYNGVIYNGKGTILDGSSPITSSDSKIVVTEPQEKSFQADGFFMIRGQVTYTGDMQYAWVRIVKGSQETSYWVRGNFEKRLWLRFGSGDYNVYVHRTKITDGNLGYNGDILGWIYYTPAVYTFNVTNNRSEDGTFYYPSDPVQSDDTNIHNLALQLTSGQTTDTDRIRALHDYVVTTLYYDDASNISGQRKKQDAISTLQNGTAVCEGYTNLYNALLRSIGLRCKCIGGSANTGYSWELHAWTNLESSGNLYLVDTTWDDPGPNDADPGNLYYTYFMLTNLHGIGNDHNPQDERPEQKGNILPKWKGYPDGIY